MGGTVEIQRPWLHGSNGPRMTMTTKKRALVVVVVFTLLSKEAVSADGIERGPRS